MPGARMLMIVVMKLNAVASEAMPRICSPIDPEVDVQARGEGVGGQRRIAEPTAIGPGAEEDRRAS